MTEQREVSRTQPEAGDPRADEAKHAETARSFSDAPRLARIFSWEFDLATPAVTRPYELSASKHGRGRLFEKF